MWHSLPPDSSLPVIFQNYQLLLEKGKAPRPVPVYIDEGPLDVSLSNDNHSDLLYYLMRLHSNEERDNGFIKTMFSSSSSSDDPLDYHMIWYQREILAAVGALTSDGLQVVNMGFVAQLLSQGLCHWAIYVVLHIPYCEDYPYLQIIAIREILFRYYETWGSDDSQRQFIKDLGVPSEWMHEALVSSFIPLSAGQLLPLQSLHGSSITNHSEIWRIATSMDDHKSEIENWDLGTGIYISFYLLKSSLEEECDSMSELMVSHQVKLRSYDDQVQKSLNSVKGHLTALFPQVSLERHRYTCQSFVGRLNESLAIWDDRLPIQARVAYSKMADEISDLLLSGMTMESSRDTQRSCFETILTAPLPEDIRSTHLQDAVSLFSLYLSELGQTAA
ncbi:unnamed protein product [Arabis nemorensis]|uniref:Nuclear pore complex protein NUP96 C-terminal domain-containing protein n=1 Tax=Arabis nemorensis TaxID=586526 RepID=A0A565ARG5_9BRAS|nr:unnamed protein product [Arabis nemorensis]